MEVGLTASFEISNTFKSLSLSEKHRYDPRRGFVARLELAIRCRAFNNANAGR